MIKGKSFLEGTILILLLLRAINRISLKNKKS